MSLFDYLCDTLAENGWDYDCSIRHAVVRLEMSGVQSQYFVTLIVDEDQESILCSLSVKQRIPMEKRLAICEFINRANCELANGNFELDMEDGELRYRAFLDLSSAEPSREQVLNLIWTGAQSFDTYYPGLIQILYHNLSPNEAITLCHGSEF